MPTPTHSSPDDACGSLLYHHRIVVHRRRRSAAFRAHNINIIVQSGFPRSFPRESFECSVQQNQRFQRGNIPERRFQADAESWNETVARMSRRSRLASIEKTSSIFNPALFVWGNVSGIFTHTKKVGYTHTHTHDTTRCASREPTTETRYPEPSHRRAKNVEGIWIRDVVFRRLCTRVEFEANITIVVGFVSLPR